MVAKGSVPLPFWSSLPSPLLQALHTSPRGLSSEEARLRLSRHGANRLKPKARSDALALILAQFKSPIILILILAAGLSIFVGESADAIIIITIVAASGLLGFWQERGAARALDRLMALVRIRAKAVRDGQEVDIPIEEIVPGDVAVHTARDTEFGQDPRQSEAQTTRIRF
jgi:Mg2+-importing ATPase